MVEGAVKVCRVGVVVFVSVLRRGFWGGRGWVEEFGALGVRGDYADGVAVVAGEVGVYEDEEVGEGG